MTGSHDAPAASPPVPPGSPVASSRRERIGVRVRAQRERLTHWFAELRERSGIADAIARAWELDTEVGGGLMAGALGFRLFIFMVPYVFVVFTLLGSAATLASSSASDMADRAGIAGVLAKGVISVDSLSRGNQFALLAVAGYGTIVAARALIATTATAYCLIWRIPKVKMKRTAAAFVLIVVFSAVLWLTSYLGRLRDAAPAPGLLLTVAWLLVPIAAWWWISTRLPHGDAPAWALLPGALMFGVAVEALHLFTVYYVTRSVASKSETYGVIGGALSVLLWAYVAGRVITGSAVVNASLWRRFVQRHPDAAERVAAAEQTARSRLHLWWEWLRSAAGLLR